MDFVATCPHCGRQFNPAEDLVGKRIRCKGCGGVYRVGRQPASLSKQETTPASSSLGSCSGCLVAFLVVAGLCAGGALVLFIAVADIGARERRREQSPEAVQGREITAEAHAGMVKIRDAARNLYRSEGIAAGTIEELGVEPYLTGQYFGPSDYVITTTRGTVVYVICTVAVGENFTFSFDVAGTSEGEFGYSKIN
jgi:hypothetical protein